MTDPRVTDLSDTLPARADSAGTPAPRPTLEAGDEYAGRYRVIELLGRGGMGEVYRVHDTVLGVSVALKRVLGGTAGDRAQVIREVRLARQVTHRAVCRVFDVGESNGEYYFTMEHVHGEDLGTLLRRIGRLPPDKVIDIARQTCAGLAAAHEHGILHRDLKPANIMVDRRGDVRLTDFGIAAQGNPADAPLVGTPAYMAPELRRGAAASPQSDLYAFALVLYELLTGRRPFSDGASRDEAPPAPSTIVPDVAADFERVVLRALDPNPEARPESAVAFSAELPGGNLLKAALDAGQTPSPNLVAAATSAAPLSVRHGLMLLATGIAGLAAIVLTAETRLVDRAVLTDPPAVLAAAARTLVAQATGGAASAHSAWRLRGNSEYVQYLSTHREVAVDAQRLAEVLYRESPRPIVPLLEIGAMTPFAITFDNPPLVDPGASAVVIDSGGRLRRFRFIPAETDAARSGPLDWAPFIRASGADPASLASIVPRRAGAKGGERQSAWRAREIATSRPIRIDAADIDGRPVSFEVAPMEASPGESAAQSRATAIIAAVFSVVCLGVAGFLAYRNVVEGRADLRGARRLAQVLLACQIVSWILGASYLPLELEFQRFMIVVSMLLMGTAIAVSFYLAFEPIVRRRWPWSLIAWNRLLSRGIGDPVVARDLLIGAALSIAGTAIYQLLIVAGVGLRGDRPANIAFPVFMGARHLAAALVAAVPEALTSSMLLVLLYSVLVMVLRRGWAASAVLTAAFVIPLSLQMRPTPVEVVLLVIASALLVAVFVRVGLVALASYATFDIALSRFPMALADDWRSEFAVMTLVVSLAALIGAAYSAVRPRQHLFAEVAIPHQAG